MKYRFEKPVAGFLFFISGAVGLLYQVVWIKSLSYQLGNSAWSISTVVASFMLGLGIGSWYAGKKTDAMRFPFRTYGIIEIGIALFGIISLPLLNHLWVLITPLYDLSSQHPGLFMVIRLLLVFALLFIPTALMGASLPVLVVGLSRVSGFEKTVGLLYGINTLGAAAGVLLTGFLLLPKVGMKITVWIACLLGVLVGSISIVWQKYSQEQDQRSEPAGNTSKSKISWALLLIVFLSGALSLFYEMSWTRLLSPIFGSSTYAFSLILTTFLIGIGLGGLIASQQWINRWPYRRLLSVLIIATSISVLLGLWIVDYLPALFLKMAFYFKNNFSLFFLGQGLLASSLVFLPTLLLGITLPLAIIGFKNEQNSEGEAVGEIYLANTLGAIVGSLLAGFVILPRFGAQQAVVLAAVIGVLAAVLFARTNKSISDQEKNFWAIAGFMVFVLVFVFPPRINMRQLHGGVFRTIRDVNQESKVATQPSLLYLREGHGCTVTVYRSNSDTFLKVNGKTDASMHGDLGTQYLLAHLPMFFSVDPKKICIIGLGSGATLRAVAGHNVKKIDVIELESAVLGAQKYFEPNNKNIHEDPKVKVHLEDGRTFLQYSKEKFDVIISEPSNPWVAGVSALFTSEYYKMVKKKLAPEGIFCQWIQGYEMSQETLNVMLLTLSENFPHVYIFAQRGDFICIAMEHEFKGQLANYERKIRLPDVASTLNQIDIRTPFDLLSGYLASLPDDKKVYEALPRNSDDNLWLEYRAPLEMYQGVSPQLFPLDPELVLKRNRELLFSDVESDRIALELIKSIVRTRPQALYRVTGLLMQIKNPSLKKEAENLQVQAIKRNELMTAHQEKVKEIENAIKYKKITPAILKLAEDVENFQPRNHFVQRMLGNLFMDAEKMDQAEEHFNKALALVPHDYVSMSQLGVIELRKKKLNVAIEWFSKAVGTDPYYGFPCSYLLAIYTRLNQEIELSALRSHMEKYFNSQSIRELEEKAVLLMTEERMADFVHPKS